MQTKNTRTLVECSVLVGLAFVLSYIKIDFPFGGSITPVSMLPIILVSFRHGVKVGLGTGFVYSITQLIQGLGYIGYIPTTTGVLATIFLDYLFPFTMLGLAGLFYVRVKNKKTTLFSIVAGTLMVLIIRYISHVFVGAFLWYEITKIDSAPSDWINTVGPWVYSLGYNLSYMGPEGAVTLLASPIILKLKDLQRQ